MKKNEWKELSEIVGFDFTWRSLVIGLEAFIVLLAVMALGSIFD